MFYLQIPGSIQLNDYVYFGLRNTSEFDLFVMNPDDTITFHFGYPMAPDLPYFPQVSSKREISSVALPISVHIYRDETSESHCRHNWSLYDRRGNFYFLHFKKVGTLYQIYCDLVFREFSADDDETSHVT